MALEGMSTKLTLQLNAEDQEQLIKLLHAGTAPARVQTRARLLLLTDRSQGKARPDREVADALFICQPTVGRIRRKYIEEGLAAALSEKPRPGAPPKITGEVEARLVTLACSDPPEGQDCWTLQLLADRLVELKLVDSISPVAVYKRLKKTISSPGR
jgi:putative transposase